MKYLLKEYLEIQHREGKKRNEKKREREAAASSPQHAENQREVRKIRNGKRKENGTVEISEPGRRH